MLRKLGAALAILAACSAVFLFGVMVGLYKIPPYGAVRGVKDALTGQAPESVFYYDTNLRARKTCPSAKEDPIVIFGAGQSNASNTGSFVNPPVIGDAYLYFRGRCYALADPVLGGDSTGGSIWPLVAEEVAGATGRPVVVAVRAKSGSAIEEWTSLQSDYSVSAVEEISRMRAVDLSPDYAVWFQGETNAERKTSAKEYETQLRALIDMIALNGGRWMLIDNSICSRNTKPWEPLSQARHAVAGRRGGVFMGPNTDMLGLRYRRPDGCHLNGLGQKAVAGMIAAEIIERERE